MAASLYDEFVELGESLSASDGIEVGEARGQIRVRNDKSRIALQQIVCDVREDVARVMTEEDPVNNLTEREQKLREGFYTKAQVAVLNREIFGDSMIISMSH